MNIVVDGLTVENTESWTGNPAVTITGNGVTFVNKAGASVVGHPAITIRGQGAKIINEAGALIRGAPEPQYGHRYVAIDGSIYADIIVNYGKIVNDIQLYGGDDRYEVHITAENNVLGNPLAWLGDGDDVAIFHLDGIATLWGVETIAGAGYDTLRFEGISSSFIQTNIADQFERIEFLGPGASSRAELAYISNVQEFVLSSGLTLMLGNGSTRGQNPSAVVYLYGGNLELSSTHSIGSVLGTDAAEWVTVEGAVLGGVSTGAGDDRVAVQSDSWGGTVFGTGSIAGNVSLGAGDDVLDIGGYSYFYSGPNGSGMGYSPGGSVLGVADGGEGFDEVRFFATDGRTFSLTTLTGFESLVISGDGGGDMRLTDLQAVQSVTLNVGDDTRIAIAETAAPSLSILFSGYAERTIVQVEASTTLGAVSRAIPLYIGEYGRSPERSMEVQNAGVITGDVHLWSGDDVYDGRSGFVGGEVRGFAGNDTILLGAANDRADGGSDNDLVEGGGGADHLLGGFGDDLLRGGAGSDTLDGGENSDRLYGGEGDDLLSEGGNLYAGHDALHGGAGNDVIELVRQSYLSSPVGTFILDGGDGDDWIRVSPGFSNPSHVDVDGGAGADRVAIEYAAGTTYVRLGAGADTLFMDVLISDGWPGWNIRMLDFAPGDGGDRIDLADRPALREAFRNWDGTTDLFAAGMLRLVQRGGDTYLEGTINGWGFTPLLVFANSDARSFTATNFSGYQPVVADVYLLHEGTAGADNLGGSNGSDIYVVNDPGDAFSEFIYSDRDEVRTSLASYVLPDYVELLTGSSDLGQDLRGNHNSNAISSGAGNDLIRVNDGGDDTAFGGGGVDQFYYGAAFTAADANDGGADTDVVVLQGNYAVTMGASSLVNVEFLSLQSGTSTRYGEAGTNSYDYSITFVDANVAAGQRFTVNASQLEAGESFAFNGSAESDGSFLVYAGHGDDALVGGSGNDILHFEGTRWGAGDLVNGGAGADALVIRGSGGLMTIVFGENQVLNMESITVSDRFGLGPAGRPSYDLTLANGNVTPGGLLILNGNTLLDPSQVFNINGSAVTGGNLRMFGGAGGDRMIGGAGNDLFYSAGGQDQLTGGGGADSFQLRSLSDSTTAAPDSILDFRSGTDKIDLNFIDANSNADGNQAFSFVGASAFSGTAGELRAYDTGLGFWKVEGDVNGDGTADFALNVTLATSAILGSSDILV